MQRPALQKRLREEFLDVPFTTGSELTGLHSSEFRLLRFLVHALRIEDYLDSIPALERADHARFSCSGH